MEIKKISYIIPCYNESDVIPEFYKRVSRTARDLTQYECEFVFVNDGSRDGTAMILNELAENDSRVKVLHFAKNQGHQAAITAGMDFAAGELIVTIDADLQDPPELIHEILAKVREGYDIVNMQRRRRMGESWFKLFTARIFYWMMRKLTNNNVIDNCGDFRAFTQPVLKAVQGFREEHRFMRGIFAMLGFEQTIIRYDRDARFGGRTKYSFRNMSRLASNAILSFSSSPLRMIAWMSFFLWFISLIYLTKALIDHFVFKITVPGWTSIIILMTLFTGIIIFCLSIIATYVGRIFEQGQRRPIYWLQDVKNIDIKEKESSIDEVRLSSKIIDDRYGDR